MNQEPVNNSTAEFREATMYAVLAAIPYETFPKLPLGFNTFGLMVALGVLIGAKIAADYGEHFGVDRDQTYRIGTFMVLAGIVGSRLTWVVTHFDDIDDPVDVIAIWEGGIQFAGGFIAALAVGLPTFLRWDRVQRWHVLDGYAMGLTIGVAIGRIGCYAVGEHFGRQTSFFLGTRYEGNPATLIDDVREPTLGPDGPSIVGLTFHNTSLYELIHLVALFALMVFLVWRARKASTQVLPATIAGLFFVWYAVFRFGTDTLRVNDERVLSMTGAQWMALVMLPYGLYLLLKARPDLTKLAEAKAKDESAPAAGLLADVGDDEDEDEATVPDQLEAPDDDSDETKTEADEDDASEDEPAEGTVSEDEAPEDQDEPGKDETENGDTESAEDTAEGSADDEVKADTKAEG